MGRLPAVLQIVGPAAAERDGVGVRVPGGNDHSVLIRFDHHASAGESRRHPTGRVWKPARKPVGVSRDAWECVGVVRGLVSGRGIAHARCREGAFVRPRVARRRLVRRHSVVALRQPRLRRARLHKPQRRAPSGERPLLSSAATKQAPPVVVHHPPLTAAACPSSPSK